MASSSIVYVAIALQVLLLVSASASNSSQYIDAICKTVTRELKRKDFCYKTLKSYPPVANATNKFQAADAVLRLGMSYAEMTSNFSKKAATENPNLNKEFTLCQDVYVDIFSQLQIAAGELKKTPDGANYDAWICYDQTAYVKNLVGKNKDKASKGLISRTLMMEDFISIAVAATASVGG